MAATHLTFENISNHYESRNHLLIKMGYSKKTIEEAINYLALNAFNEFPISLDKESGIKLKFIFSNHYIAKFTHQEVETFTVLVEETTHKGPLNVTCDKCYGLCMHKAAAIKACEKVLSEDFEHLDLEDNFELLHSALIDILFEQEDLLSSQTTPLLLSSDLTFEGVSIKRSFLSKENADQFNKKCILFKKQNVELHPLPGSIENHHESHKKSQSRHKYKAEKLKPGPWPEVFKDPNFENGPATYAFSKENRQELVETASLFWYHFSDGSEISSLEISRHPYRKLIPSPFLPAVDDGDISSLDLGPWRNAILVRKNYFWGRDFAQTERMMHGLLKRIVKGSETGQINFYVQDSNKPEYAFKVNRTLEKLFDNFIWTAQSENSNGGLLQTTLILESMDSSLSWLPMNKGVIEINTGTLVPQSFSTEVENVAQIFSYYGDCNIGSPSFPNFGKLLVTGQECLCHGVHDLRSRGVGIRFLFGTHEVPYDSYKSQIQIDGTGKFGLSHSVILSSSTNISVQGLSRELINLFVLVDGGIPSFIDSDAKDLATRSKPKRDWDMKLLKHGGAFHYVVLELCSVLLEGTLTNGTVLKDRRKLWSAISGNILNLIKGDLDRPDITIEKLCSGRVIEYFEKFIKWFFENFESKTTVYGRSGEIHITGLPVKDLWLFYTLLKEYVLVNEGASFKKARVTFADKIRENIHGPLSVEILKERSNLIQNDVIPALKTPTMATSGPANLLHTLVPLRPLSEKGFELIVEGRPLEQLSEGDFSVEFLLKDKYLPSNDAVNSRAIDWFELNPKFFLKGQELNLEKGIKFADGGIIEYQGKLYLVPRKQIPSLKHLESFWLRLQNGGKKLSSFLFSEKVVSMPRSQVLDLLALRSSGHAVNGNKEWEEIAAFYDSLGAKRKSITLPKSINAELKPYQKEGVQWLCDLHSLKLGALLGDDMGLGKTLQTLSFLEVLRHQKKLGATLVVVPPSLIYNWQSEAEKFVPDLKIKIFSGKVRENFQEMTEDDPVVLITTYGILSENEALFSSMNWKVLIFDEAQNLKNMTTKRTAAARSLKAQFKICVSGTPMENHYGEFYSLIDLLVPGSLGCVNEFRQLYVNPDSVRADDIEYLRLKVKPLVLRRTKKEILSQLPEKFESKVSISFESKQKKLYRDVAISYNEKIQETIKESGEANSQLQMLTALLRLRQICSDPSALPNVSYSKVPPKLETLLESIKEVVESGESALIFTQFLTTLNRTESLLKKEGISVYTIHGGVSTSQRQKVLKAFHDDKKGCVLLMTLKTGGVGLNLTKASYVFHLEPWWNPAVENQATDRAHRIGQEKSVQVFRYIMHESVEEKIEKLKGRKEGQFRSLFADMECDADLAPKGSNRLTKEDFDLLIAD